VWLEHYISDFVDISSKRIYYINSLLSTTRGKLHKSKEVSLSSVDTLSNLTNLKKETSSLVDERMSYMDTPGLLDLLERLSEGIVSVIGAHCEVVVHDFRDPEHSAVVVAGDVTHRSPGAPVPDLSFISGELDKDTPDQLNYQIKINEHTLQSSTIWIRDPEGEAIGAICINVDYSDLQEARVLLERLSASTRNVSDLVVSNTLAKDLDNLIELSAQDYLIKNNISTIEALSFDEKLDIVELFEERGLFQIRGSVQRVAELLKVSRASVYNYRSNLKMDGSSQ
jgi:predicted transcriptional regulator YheO